MTRNDLLALLDAMHEAQKNYREHHYDCVTGDSREPSMDDKPVYLDWSIKKHRLLTAMVHAEEAYNAAVREFNKQEFAA